ncbi:MAG: hypothetical protein AAF585_18700 [Verrucomicrobiota bacterium]
MADLDDIRDGARFGLDTPADTSNFYLKGLNNNDWGVKNRMSRIFNRKSGTREKFEAKKWSFPGKISAAMSVAPLK